MGTSWGHQTPRAKRHQGLRCPHQDPAEQPLPITYRLSLLPLQAREPHQPSCPLGRKDKSEGNTGTERDRGGMGPYSQDPLGGQGCPGCPGKQQLSR